MSCSEKAIFPGQAGHVKVASQARYVHASKHLHAKIEINPLWEITSNIYQQCRDDPLHHMALGMMPRVLEAIISLYTVSLHPKWAVRAKVAPGNVGMLRICARIGDRLKRADPTLRPWTAGAIRRSRCSKLLGARMHTNGDRQPLCLDLASFAVRGNPWVKHDPCGDMATLPYALAKYVQDALWQTVNYIPIPSADKLDAALLFKILKHVRPYSRSGNARNQHAEIAVYGHLKIQHPSLDIYVGEPSHDHARGGCCVCARICPCHDTAQHSMIATY